MQYLIEELRLKLPWADGKVRDVMIMRCHIEFLSEFDGEMDGSEFEIVPDREILFYVDKGEFEDEYSILPMQHRPNQDLLLAFIKQSIIKNYDFSYALEKWAELNGDSDVAIIRQDGMTYQVPKIYIGG